MPREMLAVAALFAAVASAFAQAAPTADQVNGLIEKYRAERADAAKTFAAGELAPADEIAAKAEAALKAGNTAAASRLLRDARWQLPFLPSNLPPNVVKVLGASRLRHGDRVNSIAYSPDGARLATASRDGTVKVWDLGNGREVLTYRGHDALETATENVNVMRVPAVAFSPDGKAVASAGSKDIHVWDPKDGKLLHTLAGHRAPARGLAFKDASTLVSGADDRRVIVWDVAKQKVAIEFPEQTQRVEAVAVGMGGKLAATMNAAGELFVYPLEGSNRNPLLSVPATDGGQAGYGVAFAGESIVTCGGDSKAKLTASPDPAGKNNASGATVRNFVGHGEKVNALAVTPDGKALVTVSKDASVRLWEVATAKPIRAFQGHAGPVTAVAVSPDGTQIASGGEDGQVRLWPLAVVDDHRASTEATDSLWAVAVSPDGKRYATAGADRTVRVYDAETGKLEKPLTGHAGAIPTLVFLGNDRVASGSGDKLVKVWDLASGEAKDCGGHESAVLALAAGDGGKLLVSGSVDKTVKGWDAAGKLLWNWAGKSAVCALAVRKDGRRVAVGAADGTLTVLEVGEGKEPKAVATASAHAAGVAGVSFHPDGSRLATGGGDGYVRVWTLPETGPLTKSSTIEPPTRVGSRTGPPPIAAVAFSPDGRLLALGGAEAVTRLWDTQTNTEARSFRGHTDWVTSVGFGVDGKTVYSVGVDKVARAFELARQEAASSAGHTQPVRCVAVSRDGKLFATGSDDKTVKVWDRASGRVVATFSGIAEAPAALGFAGPETVVSSGEDGRLRWWSADTARETRSVPTGKVFNLTATPDGGKVAVAWTRRGEKYAGFEVFGPEGTAATLVTERGREISCAVLSSDAALAISGGEDGVIRVWDLGTKERVGGDWPLFVKSVADLALTPDKKTLVAIDIAGTVKIADVANRAAGSSVKAVDGTVAGIVAAPTGDRFATLAADGTVKAWDLTGKELRVWKLPVAPGAAAFLPDGKQLVVGNKDGTAYVLQLP